MTIPLQNPPESNDTETSTTEPKKYYTHQFPPFPASNESTVPYKDFQESGILKQKDENGQEIDGLGIPTVSLNTHSRSSQQPTETKKPKREKKPFYGTGKGEWYEQWNPDMKSPREYDTANNALARLTMISNDFFCPKVRWWPTYGNGFGRRPGSSHSLKELYDQWLLFIGVKMVTPIWTRTDRPPVEDDDDELTDSDDESSVRSVNMRNNGGSYVSPAQKPPRPPCADVVPIPVDSDEKVRELLTAARDKANTRMIDFLHNPDKFIRIFLSSYIREQNLIFYDRNLVSLPWLVWFFAKFVLKNRAFVDIDAEGGWEAPWRRALIVVERAKKELIATSRLSKFLPDEFGRGCSTLWGRSDEEDLPPPSATPSTPEGEYAKIIELDDDDEFEKEKAELAEQSKAEWLLSGRSSLWALGMGPTSLPLTHTRGVVEWSMRRIKDIVSPIPFSTPAPSSPTTAIEQTLDNLFYKVVLEPWTGWENAREAVDDAPRVVSSPAGAAVHDPKKDEITLLVHVPAHIREKLEVLGLIKGMGVAGTFVEIARRCHHHGEDDETRGLERTSFWYCEDLVRVVVGYHVPAPPMY